MDISGLAGNLTLKIALVALGLGIIIWGIERYRTRFVKAELSVSLAFGLGIWVLVFVPWTFSRLMAAVNLEKRYVFVSILVNSALILTVLYLLSVLHDTRNEVNELTRHIAKTGSDRPEADTGDIAVVIPAYNEAHTIQSVLTDLPHSVSGRSLLPIVISDGSEDETKIQAQSNHAVVAEHPVNQGQGGALKTGFDLAQEVDAEVIVTMDADGQHPATYLERIVTPVFEGKADFVVGSRFLGEDQTKNGIARRNGVRVFTWLINKLTKSDLTDCTSGYRAFRTEELVQLELAEEQFSAPELIIEAQKKGLRITEIPITITERLIGDSKKPKLGYAFGLSKAIFTTWLR